MSSRRSARAAAETYVYVSNADDGDIGMYRLQQDGELVPLGRVGAAAAVMPMAVSADRRFLYAASRAKPYAVHAYSIDGGSGMLTLLASAPLTDSLPYISLDRTGRYLFGASYGGHAVSVNAIDPDGRVAHEPLQVVPVGRNAHSIRVDSSNRYAYVPTLGSDAVFQFTFDAQTGRLRSNTPSVLMMAELSGPRHLVASPDDRFLYVLGELRGTVSTLALDARTGLSTEVSVASALAPGTTLRPGLPRTKAPDRDRTHDIWAADLHLTPDGRFLYVSERTSSTLALLRVDAGSGELTYVASMPTERQPRGFAIDPAGRYVVVSGEMSDRLAVHAIDPATGALKTVGRYPAGRRSNWVEIVRFDGPAGDAGIMPAP